MLPHGLPNAPGASMLLSTTSMASRILGASFLTRVRHSCGLRCQVRQTALGTSMVTFDFGYATQGRINPSAFSSALSPGHSMLYPTCPLIKRHMHVQHVPSLQALGKENSESFAASNNDPEP